MKLFTIEDEVFELDSLPDNIEEIKNFIIEYKLTVSSQQKICLFYHNMNQKENCVKLLKWCLDSCMFNNEDADILKLTLMAYYIETQTHKEECTKLFSSLEGTKYKNVLDLIKGYFFYFQQKYDTALFLLKNDEIGRNLIYLSTNQPEKVETNDPLLQGYKYYLLNDTINAIRFFTVELRNNANVLSYLIRLDPDEFYNHNLKTEKIANSIENQIVEISKISNEEEKEMKLQNLYKMNEKIEEEYFYEKGKKYHINKQYEEALENYIKCKSELANYQIKRISGVKYGQNEELKTIYDLRKNYSKKDMNPIKEFFHMKKIQKYIDESTYFNNRGYFLYFIADKNKEILDEVKNDLEDSYDFSIGPAASYFQLANKYANSEQKKIIDFNIEAIGRTDLEEIDDVLKDAILNVNESPEKSKKIFLQYLSGKEYLSSNVSQTIARGIGICLAIAGDPFCEIIFKYLNDQTNLKIFKERRAKNQ